MAGFKEKINKNTLRTMSHYNDLMIEMKNCTKELNIFIKEYEKVYFGESEFENNLQKYQTDL